MAPDRSLFGQLSGGSGDYTADREELFAGRTVAQLAADIRAAVSPAPPTPQPPDTEPSSGVDPSR